MATKVEVDLEKWYLTEPAVMAKCLADMSDDGYRGMVRVMPSPAAAAAAAQAPAGTVSATTTDVDEAPVWDMELNNNAHPEWPPVTAVLGQVVVYFGGVVQVMSVEQFTQEFGVAP
jgi:hypothetical protein